MYPLSYLLGLNRFFKGAWYEPSRQADMNDCLKLLDLGPDDRAVEIGSGDGRMVEAMALTGARVTGIEIDEKLVQHAQARIATAGLTAKTEIIQADMWSVNYSPYNKVFLYQFKNVMKQMEDKLLHELKPGSLVVSNYWTFPTWKPWKRVGYGYLYRVETHG